MTSQELAGKLLEVYILKGRYNHTAELIIDFINQNKHDEAYSEYLNDGDKLKEEWSRKFKRLLYTEFGCRLHRVKNCEGLICKDVY